ncbi:MAG: trypsin-like peptidase domain-containing protein [bacterium]|jgi:Do/DeqQ family serine protease
MSIGPRCIALAAALCVAACGQEEERVPAPAAATFREAVDRVLPSVVYIQVESARPPYEGPLPPLPGLPLPDMPPGGIQLGAGSGIILDREGYILTSDHVVEGATAVTVTLHDRREFEAHVVARDPSTDVAVLKIQPGDYPVARLGDSDQLQLGDWVLAVGSPLGLQFSVSAGVVSAKGRSIGILGTRRDGAAQAAPLEHFIQTDAAMNPGNSGGPLVDLEGRVVGINTAIASPTGLYFGYGFAVPINLARRVADQLIRQGYVSRAYLGVMLDEVESADAQVYGLTSTEGAEVVHVEPNGPADRAGVELGDIIIGIGDREVTTVSDLQAALAELTPGAIARLHIIRYGTRTAVDVELGAIRSGERPAPQPTPPGPHGIGFSVAQQGDRPVVAAVRPHSPAARAGIRPGQVILEVNRREVTTVEEFASAVRQAHNGVLSVIVAEPELGRRIINFETRP